MSRPRVIANCVANKYAGADERIVEYTSRHGGGLIAFHETEDGLVIDLYSHDASVDIRVGDPRE